MLCARASSWNPCLDLAARECVVGEHAQEWGGHGRLTRRLSGLEPAFKGSPGLSRAPILDRIQKIKRVPEPSPSVLGGRASALEQPQCLLHKGTSGGGGIGCPQKASAEADLRCGGGVGMVSESAVRLLRHDASPHTVARGLKRIHGTYVQVRQVKPATGRLVGFGLAQVDSPLPMCSPRQQRRLPARRPERR